MQRAVISAEALFWPTATHRTRALHLPGVASRASAAVSLKCRSDFYRLRRVPVTAGSKTLYRRARVPDTQGGPGLPPKKATPGCTFSGHFFECCRPVSSVSPPSLHFSWRPFASSSGCGSSPPEALPPPSSSSSSSGSRVTPSSSPVPRHFPSAVPTERLRSLFARADVLAHLLQSRLALPLLYPLNSGGALTNRLVSSSPRADPAESSKGESPAKNNPIASSRWRRSEVLMGLGTVTPMVLAATSVSRFLKAAHALSHFAATNEALHAGGGVSGLRGRPQKKPFGRTRNHFLRPQVWRVLKPGEEQRTKHLKWR